MNLHEFAFTVDLNQSIFEAAKRSNETFATLKRGMSLQRDGLSGKPDKVAWLSQRAINAR